MKRTQEGTPLGGEAPQPADPWWGDIAGEDTGQMPVVTTVGVGGPGGGSSAHSGTAAPGAPMAAWPVGTGPRASTTAVPLPVECRERHALERLRDRAIARTAGRRRHPRQSLPARAAAWVRMHMRRSERFRLMARRTMLVLAFAVALACSVGVITLNNVVIKRSAELGKLEDRRRTLRTENAMLAGDIARLGAPPRVARLARTRLGMSPSAKMATFIWLDPANRPVDREAVERARLRAERRRDARQARAGAATPAAQPGAAAAAPASAPPTPTPEDAP